MNENSSNADTEKLVLGQHQPTIDSMQTGQLQADYRSSPVTFWRTSKRGAGGEIETESDALHGPVMRLSPVAIRRATISS